MTDSVIRAYDRVPATCDDWDPRAPDVARRVSALIRRRLPDAEPEHIGSTAAGCAGKGVIDLMIPFSCDAQLRAIKDGLEALGFQRQGGPDPWPEDRPMRVGAIEHGGRRYRLHVHVVPRDSPETETTRAFRDRLRADAAFRDAYVATKREIIASGASDSHDYATIKGDWVRRALADDIVPAARENREEEHTGQSKGTR